MTLSICAGLGIGSLEYLPAGIKKPLFPPETGGKGRVITKRAGHRVREPGDEQFEFKG
jgi:hypothetical protein